MPLICANMLLGKELSMAAKSDATPFATTPPDARFINSGPSTGSPEIMELAVMSPYDSMAVMTKMMLSEIKADRLKPMPNLNGTGR